MKRLVLASAVAAFLVVPVAAPAFAEPGPGDGPPGPAARERGPFGRRFQGEEGRCRPGMRRQMMQRMQRRRAHRLLRALDLTDAQRALVKESRDATATLREDVHAQVRGVIADAWKAGDRSPEARKAVREKIQGILASARTSVEPQAKKLLDALTPEQRTKIQEKAKAHGKTVDDAKLLKGLEHLLLMGRGRDARAGAGK